MNGLYAFIAGLAAVLIAFLSGRRSQKKDDEAKVAQAEKKAEISQGVSDVTNRTSYEKGRIEAEYEAVSRDIERAKRNNDVDALGRIAAEQAQRAIAKGATEEDR